MDYRTGKCSQCGAEYKVPASFAHNVARCKKCKGVVHLGAPSGASATPAAAPAEPGPAPASIPAKRVVPKPPAPKPGAPRPIAPLPQGGTLPPTELPPRPEARPAAPRPAAASATPAKGGTLERLKGERSAPAPVSPVRPSPTGASRQGADEDDGPREKRPGRGERARPGREKKKAPMAGILSGVGVVILAAVLFLFRDKLFGEDSQPEVAGATPQGTTPATPAAASAGAPAPEPEEAREELAPEAQEPKPAAKPEPKAKDPASIDLAAIPDFQPTPDTTPEEWAQMNEWMAQWMDVDAGAAGNRAKLELVKRTRKAVPAILNFFKKQDFATKEGRSNGDQCQKALQQICNGTNFDWKYADEAAGRPYDHPDDVWFCKRVVELWSNSWKQAEQDIRAWIKIAKLEEKDPAEAKRLLEMFGGQVPEPAAGADDDLEVD